MKNSELEKKIEELENRIQQLEKINPVPPLNPIPYPWFGGWWGIYPPAYVPYGPQFIITSTPTICSE